MQVITPTDDDSKTSDKADTHLTPQGNADPKTALAYVRG